MKKIIFFVLALLYAVMPIDLFPDVFIGWGQIDDLIILGLVIWYILTGNVPGFFKQTLFRFYRNTEHTDHQNSSHQERAHKKTSDSVHSEMAPHEILGVGPTASKDEIRMAYRKLANQYHPDKVHHLGTEFQQLAEVKFKVIQEAYQKLMDTE